jgi:hypothetical protein
MWPYLVVFILSFLLVKIAWSHKKNSFSFYILTVIAILIPSFLAGCRDITVGRDARGYMIILFQNLKGISSIKNLDGFIADTDLETGFVLFNFLALKIDYNIFWPFFIQQIIVLGLILLATKQFGRSVNGPFLYFCYLLYSFCSTLNIIRQAFSLAVIFYSYVFVLRRKIIPFTTCIAIATFMHSSAILAAPIYLISLYCQKKDVRLWTYIIFICSGGLLFSFFPRIITQLINLGVLSSKYIMYIDKEYEVHKTDWLLSILCFLYALFYHKDKCLSQEIKVFSIITFFLLLCGVYNDVAQRVALYYILFLFVKMAMMFRGQKGNEFLHETIATCILLSIYFFLAIKYKISDTIPYTSKVLGI